MKIFPWRVWLFALVFAVLTALPYLVGWLNTPPEWTYSGAPAVPTGTRLDYYSHLAKMWQGSRGQWTYQLLFTPEPHPGVPLLQGFYVALGAISPLSLPLTYHLARFGLAFGLVLALWRLVCRFFETGRERWLALFLATFAGGWSWLLLIVDPALTANISPIEFWLLDAFNFLGALTTPHFAAALILQIVVLLAFLDWLQTGRWRSLVVLTLALVVESFIQPYSVLLFGSLMAIWALYQVFITRKVSPARLFWLALPLGIHAALIVYQYVAVSGDPVWADFTAQNQTLSPPVIFYLSGYLPFLLPLLAGIRKLWRADDVQWRILLLWVVLVAVLVYVPLPTQRRYLLGVQTPLALLSAFGWSRVILPRVARGYRPVLTAIYVTLAAVSMGGILMASTTSVMQPEKSGAHFTADETQAYAWLRDHVTDGIIFTTFDRSGQGNGGKVVAATGLRVYAGHWIETAFLDSKVPQMQRFYDPATADTWRQAFLKEIGAAFVCYDEDSQAMGDWNPAAADYLQPVFESATVTIFQVL